MGRENRYSINIVPNKSKTYILPLLNKSVKFQHRHLLVNSYISYNEGDEIFCVLYKWDNSKEFLEFEGKMMIHPLFINQEDFDDMTCYKFRLSPLMSQARELFVQGKLKELDDSYKQSIIDYLYEIKVTNVDSISRVLNLADPKTSSESRVF